MEDEEEEDTSCFFFHPYHLTFISCLVSAALTALIFSFNLLHICRAVCVHESFFYLFFTMHTRYEELESALFKPQTVNQQRCRQNILSSDSLCSDKLRHCSEDLTGGV